MRLNIKNFKKIGADEHFTTMRNEAGHEIKISHKGLHPATRGQLAALPMAKGGEIQSERTKRQELLDETKSPELSQMLMNQPRRHELTDPVEAAPTGETPSPTPKKYAEGTPDGPISLNLTDPKIPEEAANINPPQLDPSTFSSGEAAAPYTDMSSAIPGLAGLKPDRVEVPTDKIEYPEEAPPAMAPEVSNARAPASPPTPPSGVNPQATASGQVDPYGTNAYQDAYMKGLNSQMAGLAGEAKAAEAQGTAQAELLGKQQGIQAQQATEYQTHYKALEAERAALMKDIQDQHIDPNHFVNTQDGASKIATAIGLIASGIGGGMSHQSNLAADFLHKQIENDIQAQKANLGQKENLLSANMRQFGNMRDAMDMTRVMQSDILANQLKMEAAKQAGPMAKANLLKAAGDLEMRSAPVLSQIAMKKTLLSGMTKGQVAPESVIRMVVPEHEQAGATKELKEAQAMYRMRDNALSAFDQISKINTPANRVGSPLQSRSQIHKIVGALVPTISKESAGRYTESDAKAIEDVLVSKAYDSDASRALGRRELDKLLSGKLNFPELKKWGIDLSNTGRYDMSGKPRIPEGKPVR